MIWWHILFIALPSHPRTTTKQFENLANFRSHYETTGPEIYRQARGRVDAFVCAAGTGGTLGGVSVYLKQKLPSLKVRLFYKVDWSVHPRSL